MERWSAKWKEASAIVATLGRSAIVLLAVSFFFLGTVLPAQDFDFANYYKSLKMRAVRTDTPIEIDGVLDEAAWDLAEPATNFIQKLPATGKPATEQTEVRLLYDEDNLYVGVYCWDSAGRAGIVVNDISKDFYTLDSDGFQIILDTFNDDRNAFLFGTNPEAGKFDMQIRQDGNGGNSSWDGIWFVETKITDKGWQIEIAIPFKTLRFTSDELQVWGVNFERRVRRKFEDSYWSPLPPPYRLGRISLGGELEGIHGIKQGRNLWIKPYVSAPIIKREGDDWDFQPDVGLDVKYGVTSELTLDLTANTDFSQVEADEQRVNLTRFSLFFPEKRDFFLENSGIFDFGRRQRGMHRAPDLVPFFTRRIGLTDDGGIVPILGGARLTGNAGGMAIGLLNMTESDFTTRADDDEPGDYLPQTNYTVVRLRRDVLRKSDIGGIFVNKDLCGEGFNRTYGFDGNFNFFNYLDLTAYVLKTDSPGLVGGDYASNVEFSWVDNFFEASAGHLRIGENFNPEVGFAPRTGVYKTSGEFGITPRPEEKISWIREFNPQIQTSYITDIDNRLVTRIVDASFRVTFSDSSFIRFARESNFERLDEEFDIQDVIIPAGDYNFAENQVFYRSDRSRMLGFSGRWNNGGFYGGDRNGYGGGVTFTPNYKFSTEVEWSRNDIELPGGAFTTDLVAAKLEYSISNEMFLNALIQYNTAAQELSSNVRFNFVHRPLSDFYLVYNERRSTGGEVIDRAIIAKLTYLFAF